MQGRPRTRPRHPDDLREQRDKVLGYMSSGVDADASGERVSGWPPVGKRGSHGAVVINAQ